MALAANQVGRLKRVFVAEIEGEEYVVVNPAIEEKTWDTEIGIEGYLSIPGIGVEVERHEGVVVSGQDAEGRPVRLEVTGHAYDAARDRPPRQSADAGPYGPGVAQAGHATVARTPARE